MLKWFSGGEDYEKTLRGRLWLGGAFVAAGLAGLLCWLLFRERMGESMRGYCLGGACGVLAGGGMLLLRTRCLLRHPEARRRARIRDTDEREKNLTRSAARAAGIAVALASALGSFVVLPFSPLAAKVLWLVSMAYAFVFAVARGWMDRTR